MKTETIILILLAGAGVYFAYAQYNQQRTLAMANQQLSGGYAYTDPTTGKIVSVPPQVIMGGLVMPKATVPIATGQVVQTGWHLVSTDAAPAPPPPPGSKA